MCKLGDKFLSVYLNDNKKNHIPVHELPNIRCWDLSYLMITTIWEKWDPGFGFESVVWPPNKCLRKLIIEISFTAFLYLLVESRMERKTSEVVLEKGGWAALEDEEIFWVIAPGEGWFLSAEKKNAYVFNICFERVRKWVCEYRERERENSERGV